MEAIAFKSNPLCRYIELSLYERLDDGYLVVDKLEMKKYSENSIIDPTISLNYNEAQKLMDTLWDCGVRPSEGHGSAGQKAALEKHLSDMRKIVSKKLNVDL